MTVHVLPLWHKPMPPGVRVSTVMNSGVFRMLSPFVLGPVKTYEGMSARNVENAWQYSKVYARHAKEGEPTVEYYPWRDDGWANERAIRYPMGKGAVPEFSLWDGRKLGYVEARKAIYAPVYAKAVEDTEAFDMLRKLYDQPGALILLDYDAYDHHALGMHLTEVIDNPKRKMGHAFVLAMMLEGSLDWCLEDRPRQTG
ncbi:MAG: DUF6939 family protein [Candidatus Bathyanammoxibius sp.]